MGPFLLENQLCLFRPFVCNSAENGSVFHTFPIKNGMISRFLLIIPQRPVRESNPHLVLRSTTLRCQTQLSEVLLSQVKSRLFSVPNPVRDNPCYSLLLAVHPFLLANLWHLPPFGECSRESSKA